MAEQRVRFEGVTASEDYVTVYFTVGERQAKRVREVKVPYADLLDAEVVIGVNREASRRLSALWEATEETLPW
jgi:hypothetical protein